MTNSTPTKNTTAFFAQAGVSFAIALLTMLFAIHLPARRPVGSGPSSALGTMFLTTSSFTLAKCVRDNQETQTVVHRLDQARVDQLLAEHDPFRAVS